MNGHGLWPFSDFLLWLYLLRGLWDLSLVPLAILSAQRWPGSCSGHYGSTHWGRRWTRLCPLGNLKWLWGLCCVWFQECCAGDCLSRYWIIRGLMWRVCIFEKYKQPLVGLWKGGDNTVWQSRKITTNGILRGSTGVLAMCPISAYVIDPWVWH